MRISLNSTSSTGPTSTGPTSTGPTSTGPTSTGPTSTGPIRTDPISTGTNPITTGPISTDSFIIGDVLVSASDYVHEGLTHSHKFEIQKDTICGQVTDNIFHEKEGISKLVKYGKILFKILFQEGTLASQLLQNILPPNQPGQVLLELNGKKELDDIPWEYVRDSEDCLVRRLMFTRVLKREQPELPKSPPFTPPPLRIVVVAPDPIDINNKIADLHLRDQFQNFIDGHYRNKRQIILDLVIPPTVDRMTALIPHERPAATALHFMGHCTSEAGSNNGSPRALVFEDPANGQVQKINTARLLSIPENLRFAYLSACNTREIARIMVERGVPYTIGSFCSLPNDIACMFENRFYDFLANGYSIDEAMWRTRVAISDESDQRQSDCLPGALILYSSALRVNSVFQCAEGKPIVNFNMPPNNLKDITRTLKFCGRKKELGNLYVVLNGMAIRGTRNCRVYTITGIGGQGKTTLAMEAVSRTSHCFPGGIFAWQFSDDKPISATDYLWGLLEFLLSRDVQGDLTDFRNRIGDNQTKLKEVLFKKLSEGASFLLVLDHVDTLIRQTQKWGAPEALLELVQWFKDITSNVAVKILATSHEILTWPTEEYMKLDGFIDSNIAIGREIFARSLDAEMLEKLKGENNDNIEKLMNQLVGDLDGHPLSLVLLARVASLKKNFSKSLEEIVLQHRTLLADSNNLPKFNRITKSLEDCFIPLIMALPDQQQLILYICSLFTQPIEEQTIKAFFNDDILPIRSDNFNSSEINNDLQQLYHQGLLIEMIDKKYRIHAAVREVVKRLDTKFKADDERLLLHRAAKYGHVQLIESLCKSHADVNAKDNYGLTPLHAAAQNGQAEVVESLVNTFGADAQTKDNYGWTPLHLAAQNKNIKVVALLVSKFGADKNAKDNYGWTPLHSAVQNGHVDVVNFLVTKFGADKNAKDNSGWTPLHAAAQIGNLPIIEQLMSGVGTDANAKKNNGWTPLHSAAQNGHVDVVKSLIRKFGADKNAKDNYGWTPLHLAAQNGHEHVVKSLVECNVDLNAKKNDGWTPLHSAAQNGHLTVVKFLVSKGANVDARNNCGKRSFDLAEQKGYKEVEILLK